MKHHILVIGAGSVGKRHIGNFVDLGCDISIVEKRADRIDEVEKMWNVAASFHSVDDALLNGDFTGSVIASPTKFHAADCIKLIRKRIPIFLEKPVSINLNEACSIHHAMQEESFEKLLLGYSYRWWEPLNELRARMDNGEIGKPLHAKFVMSAHLADWHPWERYQDFFMASKDLGGGALLDESHFMDLMYSFFGMPEKIVAKVNRISGLEIDSDDNVDMIASYGNGLQTTMHLDIYGRPHEKYIVITGENGTLRWSFEPNAVSLSRESGQAWDVKEFTMERNKMFIDAAVEFLGIIENTRAISCTINDGMNVMKLIEIIRESSERECFIDVASWNGGSCV